MGIDRIAARSLRTAAIGLAAAVLALSLSPASHALAAAVDWPQAHSDIVPDPAIRFGALPNGMRYEIMKNATPKGVVSIRLRIGAGSLEEHDDQQGLAHFLEHMAFRGSTHVPMADVWRDIQRLGMTIGADANAHTALSETVYQFDLPKNDPDTVAAGLMRFRETASELTLSQTAMDAERGVVLSEMRLGDTPTYHAQKAQLAFLLQGQRLPTRLPIGQPEVLQNAPVSLISDFYHAYYRPENATLVVVGDIDPDAVEAQIKARFSDWKPLAAPGADPALGTPLSRGTQAKLFFEAGAQPQMMLAWMSPYDPTVDTLASERRDTLQQIGLLALTLRLQVAASSPERPFIGAAAQRQDVYHSAKMTLLAINPAPDHPDASLKAAETIRRQIVQYGVRQDEVDQVVALLRTSFEARAGGAATRPSPTIAESLLTSADSGKDVPTSPQQDLDQFRKDVAGLTAAQVTAALRETFAGSGPLLYASSPRPIDGGEAGLGATLAAADAAPIAAAAADANVTWPYASFGAPGKVVAKREVADLGVTMVTFANGVRLAVKPTKFDINQVLVGVSVGEGMLGAPKDQMSLRWAVQAVQLGGLKAIKFDDMRRVLASKSYSEGLGWGDNRFELSGTTKTQDIDTQMQVLAAYVTAPGWRPEAFERIRANYIAQLPQSEATPQGVMSRQLLRLLHDGDLRWATPDAGEAAAVRPDDLRAALSPAFAKDPLTVTMVGDLTVDQAIAATAATFGALPPRPADGGPPAAGRQVHFPAPTASPVVLHHKGQAEKAVAVIAWPVADFYSNPKRARDLRLLERIMNQRLLEQLRIAAGATYSPSTLLETSEMFAGYGYLTAFAETPTTKLPLFYDTLAKIAADLKAEPVAADELERARAPRIEQIVQAQQTNAYWLGQIAEAQVDPRTFDTIRTTIPDLKRVTAADVQAVARAYLKDDTAWKLTVLPEATAP
jgi:zinc protease